MTKYEKLFRLPTCFPAVDHLKVGRLEETMSRVNVFVFANTPTVRIVIVWKDRCNRDVAAFEPAAQPCYDDNFQVADINRNGTKVNMMQYERFFRLPCSGSFEGWKPGSDDVACERVSVYRRTFLHVGRHTRR